MNFPKLTCITYCHFLKVNTFSETIVQKDKYSLCCQGFGEQPVSLSNGISLLLCFANEKSTAGQDFLLAEDDLYLKCSVRFLVSHILPLDTM